MPLRREFIQHLSTLLQSTDHILMNCEWWPWGFINERKLIKLMIRKNEMDTFVTSIRNLEDVDQVRLLSRYRFSKLTVKLKDGEKVYFILLHKLTQKALVFFEEEDIYTNCVKKKSGICIPSIEHHFCYVVLKNFLNGRGVNQTEFQYFNDLHILVKEDLLEYFNNRYGTHFSSFRDIKIFDNNQRVEMLKQLKQMPANKFMQTANLRWQQFVGAMRTAKLF